MGCRRGSRAGAVGQLWGHPGGALAPLSAPGELPRGRRQTFLCLREGETQDPSALRHQDGAQDPRSRTGEP